MSVVDQIPSSLAVDDRVLLSESLLLVLKIRRVEEFTMFIIITSLQEKFEGDTLYHLRFAPLKLCEFSYTDYYCVALTKLFSPCLALSGVDKVHYVMIGGTDFLCLYPFLPLLASILHLPDRK